MPVDEFVDEHVVAVDAPANALWAALVHVLRRDLGAAMRVARLLGCEPAAATEEFDGQPGQAIPGFRVVESGIGHRLTLEGRHRYSEYALTFNLEPGLLRASTRATFPGTSGRLYRAAVIGSGAHRLATRRLLRTIAGTATRSR